MTLVITERDLFYHYSGLPAFKGCSSVSTIIWEADLLIPEILGLYVNCTTLICTNGSLASLNGIEAVPQLLALTISHNCVSSLIPLRFCSVLRYLDCSYNRLSTLKGLGNCQDLIVLNCSNNIITSLRGLGSSHRLIDLNCSYNCLRHLQGIAYPNHIERLISSHNYINTLKGLRAGSLTDFDCQHNLLVDLRGWLCPNLKAFRCQANRLTTLRGIGSSTKLTEIDCSINEQLADLCGLNSCPNLRIVIANHCGLTHLRDIRCCRSIKELSCSWNKLTSLGDISDCKAISTLVCASNYITTLRAVRLMTNLEHLDCAGNFIMSLYWLKSNTNLRRLVISFNRLSTLAGIEACSQLQQLDLQSNAVVSLEPLRALVNLTEISCQHNIITSLVPVSLLPSLRILHHYYNPLESDRVNKPSIYLDAQNAHDSSVQESVTKAVAVLLKDPTPIFSLHTIKISKYIHASTKRILYAYMRDQTKHSVCGLTYAQLLARIWQRIEASVHKLELFRILEEQVLEATDLCFTGRFNRTLITLAGFDPEISIGISDNTRISAIVDAARTACKPYDAALHYATALAKLTDAGYTVDKISPWLTAIRELDEDDTLTVD